VSTASLTIVYDQPIAMTPTTAPVGFAEAYTRHADAVFRAALRVTGNPADAEDILQTVFLRMLAHGGDAAAAPLRQHISGARRSTPPSICCAAGPSTPSRHTTITRRMPPSSPRRC